MKRCRGFLKHEAADASDSEPDDAGHSGDFLPLSIDDSASLTWQPADVPVTLASVLSCPPTSISGFAADGTTPTMTQLTPEWEDSSLEPLNLLRRALREHHPELYVPLPGCGRRVKAKCAPPLGRLLRDLQAKPLSLQSKRLCRRERQQAVDEFTRRYASASEHQFNDIRNEAHGIFCKMSPAEKAAWHVVSQVAAFMYEHRPGCKRQLKGAPDASTILPSDNTPGEQQAVASSFLAYGMLLTWNVTFGLEDPAVQAIVQQETDPDRLLAALKAMPHHRWFFDAFVSRTQALSQELGLASWAACMELSGQAATLGRVHLHAFLGPGMRRNSGFGASGLQKVTVQMQSLRWHGRLPDVSLMQVGRRRAPELSIAGGMCYVLACKEGSMFRMGSVEPFKDSDTSERTCAFSAWNAAVSIPTPIALSCDIHVSTLVSQHRIWTYCICYCMYLSSALCIAYPLQ